MSIVTVHIRAGQADQVRDDLLRDLTGIPADPCRIETNGAVVPTMDLRGRLLSRFGVRLLRTTLRRRRFVVFDLLLQLTLCNRRV